MPEESSSFAPSRLLQPEASTLFGGANWTSTSEEMKTLDVDIPMKGSEASASGH